MAGRFPGEKIPDTGRPSLTWNSTRKAFKKKCAVNGPLGALFVCPSRNARGWGGVPPLCFGCVTAAPPADPINGTVGAITASLTARSRNLVREDRAGCRQIPSELGQLSDTRPKRICRKRFTHARGIGNPTSIAGRSFRGASVAGQNWPAVRFEALASLCLRRSPKTMPSRRSPLPPRVVPLWERERPGGSTA